MNRWQQVFHLRRAAGGADGTTAFNGARRATLTIESSEQVSQAAGSPLPDLIEVSATNVYIDLEIEDFDQWFAHATTFPGELTIVLGIRLAHASTPNRKITAKLCKCTGSSPAGFLPANQGGPVTPFALRFKVELGTGVTTLAQALVTATDS
jgi:hypothetical protein